MSAFDNDLADIRTVVAFLSTELGYIVDLIIGHSRGAIVAFKWISSTPEGRRVSYFVNCSGRNRTKVNIYVYCKRYGISLSISPKKMLGDPVSLFTAQDIKYFFKNALPFTAHP